MTDASYIETTQHERLSPDFLVLRRILYGTDSRRRRASLFTQTRARVAVDGRRGWCCFFSGIPKREKIRVSSYARARVSTWRPARGCSGEAKASSGLVPLRREIDKNPLQLLIRFPRRVYI